MLAMHEVQKCLLLLQFEASLAPIPLDNLDTLPQTNPGSTNARTYGMYGLYRRK